MFIKKVINYIKTHTFKQIIKRILGIKDNFSKEAKYTIWIDNNEPKQEEINEIKKFIPKYKYKFLFVVNSNFSDSLIKSINKQTYLNYDILRYSEENEIENLIKNNPCDYVVFIKEDCILSEIMLYEFLRKIDLCSCDVIYSDSDIIEKSYDNDNKIIIKRRDPIFRPDFAIDTLRSKNYIGNCIAVKKDKLVNFIKPNYNSIEFNFDLVFRAYENNLSIIHIPKVLYHDINRHVNTNYNEEIQIISSHLNRLNINAKVEQGIHFGQYHVIYDLSNIGDKVSIIIPNMDHVDDLKKCISSIKKSTYKNYEIIIVENNSKNEDTFNYYKEIESEANVIVEKFEISYFNYSEIVNYGVSKASGKYIILLNNDIIDIYNKSNDNIIKLFNKTKLFYNTIFKNNMINTNFSDEEIYDNFLSLDVNKEAIINQSQVIKKIANNGSAVIVGRCADYILKDNDALVKIFIYANIDYRIQNIMKNYQDNEKQAKKHIIESDKSRAAYYSAIANSTWGDKNNYDLCIDAKIGNENVVKIICDYINNN